MVVGMRLLPEQIEEELELLQDRVPPRPFVEILGIVEDELGCPIGDVFSHFEEEPLGAASIGQTHRAKLVDGTDVVVKVGVTVLLQLEMGGVQPSFVHWLYRFNTQTSKSTFVWTLQLASSSWNSCMV